MSQSTTKRMSPKMASPSRARASTAIPGARRPELEPEPAAEWERRREAGRPGGVRSGSGRALEMPPPAAAAPPARRPPRTEEPPARPACLLACRRPPPPFCQAQAPPAPRWRLAPGRRGGRSRGWRRRGGPLNPLPRLTRPEPGTLGRRLRDLGGVPLLGPGRWHRAGMTGAVADRGRDGPVAAEEGCGGGARSLSSGFAGGF